MTDFSSKKKLDLSVAIVFVNYNTSDQIISCIYSLREERYSKIIVVDNASPDDCPECIVEEFPDVVLIKSEKNLGFGEGCNIGKDWVIVNTDCEYIFFLNPDTLVEPGLLQLLHDGFFSPEVGLVTPRITMMGDGLDILWYGGGYMNWLTGSARVPGCGLSAVSKIALEDRFVEFASGCAFMIRRSVLEECGGFDPRYFMYEEDVELSLRVISYGYKIYYMPKAVVRHLAQGSQGKEVEAVGMFKGRNPKLPFFVYQTAKNRFLTVFTHGTVLKKGLFLIGFMLWVFRNSFEWVRYKRLDAYNALFLGIKDFVKYTYVSGKK
ncbi:glycosyltransferase family 2 protein [Methylobacillus flagellatus]|nr:glycosyltransferase family 2 protein [Methylobacillus flagellatus]